jgi:hypothetical protein
MDFDEATPMHVDFATVVGFGDA